GPGPRSFYRRAFTPLITLWYLVFQRLNYNHHLSYVVQDALAGGADRLSPRGKKLSRQLRSEATSSFSDARQRLPLELCRRVLRHSAAQMAACLPGAPLRRYPAAFSGAPAWQLYQTPLLVCGSDH